MTLIESPIGLTKEIAPHYEQVGKRRRIAGYTATVKDGETVVYSEIHASYHTAEIAADTFVYDLLSSDLVISATALDAGEPDDGGECPDGGEDCPDGCPTHGRCETQLDAAWRAYQAGALTWPDVQAIQDNRMPRCPEHNRPAKIYIDGRPTCAQCVAPKALAVGADEPEDDDSGVTWGSKYPRKEVQPTPNHNQSRA